MGFAGVDLEGAFAGDVDRSDVSDGGGVGSDADGGAGAGDAEDDVGGGEGGAVVEADAGAEGEFPGCGVDGAPGFGEGGDGAEMGVLGEEGFVDVELDHPVGGVALVGVGAVDGAFHGDAEVFGGGGVGERQEEEGQEEGWKGGAGVHGARVAIHVPFSEAWGRWRRWFMARREMMSLGAFVHETGQHVAGWRHPGADTEAGTNFGQMVAAAQTAERGCSTCSFWRTRRR